MNNRVIRPTWAEIDCDALEHNFREIQRIVGKNAKIMGVVKADAYGHGSLECARILSELGVDMLAVSFMDEAIVLRRAGITKQILLLGHTPKASIPDLIHWNVIPGVYQTDFAKTLSDYCVQRKIRHPIHIKVDTGMGRIGFSWQEATREIEALSTLEGIELEGLYTHFSTADAKDKGFTQKQIERYKIVVSGLQEKNIHIPIKHVANSAGIFDVEGTHFDMVRAGIILYGLYPSSEVDRSKINLKPVMTLKSTIVHLKTIHKGDSLGYGNTFVANEDRVIGTLPIGYADGYSRILSGKAHIRVAEKNVPQVGNICMDQCMIDVSDAEGVALYDTVELFGKDIPVDDLAEKLGTINYEVVCMVNKRVPRVYIKDGVRISVRCDILD